ncbi:VacJ family lipoprotein [Falsigemmobacter faecalis]|uniref:VacJ family lipoprotein n=1 Tax=Falsigemmobacter faecalis TaxID=2488730 RepID=A0A3P3DIL4_9RHOB|nr:VacJ family lipoprotein [Falsigemmobacter faecalis]
MAALSAAVLLTACAPAPRSAEDPLEPVNRAVHGFNLAADRFVLRPAAVVSGPVMQSPVGTAVSNFSDNLGTPQAAVNHLLQARFADATHSAWRFAVNSTIGLAGLFDPATVMGLEERDTDFGETLHSWGMGEGPFVMLPLKGPSNARDALGEVVDVFTDPLDNVLSDGQQEVATGAWVLSKVGDRARYLETVDSILYGSADSYAQTRLMYQQNRRFELGQEAGDDAFIDPYEDADSN